MTIRKRKKQYNKDNKIRINNQRLKRSYGITLEEYNKLFKEQEGKCVICGRHQSELDRTLSVDHNHTTGEIRRLLCRSCNGFLGWYELQKDNINKYLKENE